MSTLQTHAGETQKPYGAFLNSRHEVTKFIDSLSEEERRGAYLNKKGCARFVLGECIPGSNYLIVDQVEGGPFNEEGAFDLSIFKQHGIFFGGRSVRTVADESIVPGLELPPQSEIQFLLLGRRAVEACDAQLQIHS